MQKHTISPQQDAGTQFPVCHVRVFTVFAQEVRTDPIEIDVEEDGQEEGEGDFLVEVLVAEGHVLFVCGFRGGREGERIR